MPPPLAPVPPVGPGLANCAPSERIGSCHGSAITNDAVAQRQYATIVDAAAVANETGGGDGIGDGQTGDTHPGIRADVEDTVGAIAGDGQISWAGADDVKAIVHFDFAIGERDRAVRGNGDGSADIHIADDRSKRAKRAVIGQVGHNWFVPELIICAEVVPAELVATIS